MATPPWLEISFYGNALSGYLIAAFHLAAWMLIFVLLRRLLLRHFGRREDDFHRSAKEILGQIGPVVFFVVALYLASLPLHLDERVRQILRSALITVLSVRAVFILQGVVKYGIARSFRRVRPNDPSAETLIRNLTNVVRWALWMLAAVFVLGNLGVNISALVAGLGIGGIAVAMGSQAVLGDFFSALSIFTDKPFEVGDFIIVDVFMGTVESIGLKTTRIRSLSGEQIIFANSDLTRSRIKNYKRMELRRIVFKLGIAYQTSLEKTKKIPQIIKGILAGIRDVKLDRAHFEGFGDSALNFEVVYFVLSADYGIYMDRQQELNLAIKEVFEKEGIEFAYPTQTLHIPGIKQVS